MLRRTKVIAVCSSCVGLPAAESGLQKAVEGSSIETTRHMVASGMGVTVLPCTAVSGPGHDASKRTEIRPFATSLPAACGKRLACNLPASTGDRGAASGDPRLRARLRDLS